MTPTVIDVYHGNVVLDFAQTKASGVIGIIHKASQGLSMVDGMYAARRSAVLNAGMLWGAYHFFTLDDPVAQAANFLSVANPDDTTLVALDWETVGNKQPSADSARAFLTEIQTALGRSAVLYSGNVAKEQISGKDEFFGSHRLWLAQYGPNWKVQESWSSPWLWQFSESCNVPGLRSPSDGNVAGPDVDLIGSWAS